MLPLHFFTKVEDDGFAKAFTSRFSKFTRGEVNEAVAKAKVEEGQCATLWDLVQGLTASAREYEWIDARMNLETRAGELLNLAN